MSEVADKELIKARERAEAAVADMPDNDFKIATYQTILAQLVQHALARDSQELKTASAQFSTAKLGRKPAGTTSRILSLIDEGFFDQPRSLAEIRETLADKGFHYRLEDLGTPLTRMVQRKHLRRSQASFRGKQVWRYSNY